MKKINLIIFLFFIIYSVIPFKNLPASDITSDGWIKKFDNKEFSTYFRDVKGMGTGEVMMTGVVDAHPYKCFKIITDYNNFSKFMPFIEFAKIIHSEKINSKKTINYVFFYVSTPVVPSRYYTIKLTDEKNFNGELNVYKSQWELEKGSYKRTPEHPDIKPYLETGWQKPIETSLNKGYWLFKPIDNAAKTEITYYVCSNPGGSLPSGMVNEVNTVALPKLWNAVKTKLKD